MQQANPDEAWPLQHEVAKTYLNVSLEALVALVQVSSVHLSLSHPLLCGLHTSFGMLLCVLSRRPGSWLASATHLEILPELLSLLSLPLHIIQHGLELSLALHILLLQDLHLALLDVQLALDVQQLCVQSRQLHNNGLSTTCCRTLQAWDVYLVFEQGLAALGLL
jgi:hypothetical protein